MKKVYTIGHSVRGPKEFILLLEKYKIETLVDVRRFPTSKFEHFKRENLEEILRLKGVKYVYLGEQLGGYRSGGYREHMKSLAFNKGLKKLEKIAEKSKTVIMCAEKFPWRCHRKYISMSLEKNGWTVIHILDAERTWIPKKKSAEKES